MKDKEESKKDILSEKPEELLEGLIGKKGIIVYIPPDWLQKAGAPRGHLS